MSIVNKYLQSVLVRSTITAMRQAIEQFGVIHARSNGDSVDLSAPLAVKSWRGASGRYFQHTVYSLIGCPAPESASFILVRRGADGERRVLSVGCTETKTASLNLARIRRKGATLGANEVHIYSQAPSETARAAVNFDIAAAHEDPAAAPAHH